MIRNPNRSYNPTSTFVNRSLRSFLIPASEQRQFLILFTLITSIGLVLGIFTVNLLILKSHTFAFFAAIGGIWQIFLHNLVIGACLGIAQWSILRKYIPSSLWIVATSVGWAISAVIAITCCNPIGGALNGIFYLWLGVTQWLLLRRYVVNAGWWILVVPFSVYVFRLIAAIVLFAVIQTNLTLLQSFPSAQILIQSIFAAVPLGGIQAISLCILRKKSSRSAANFISQLESPLFSATEITDKLQMKALSTKLYDKIEKYWNPKNTFNQDLIYIVAIASDGSIIFYHPVNQPAINHVCLTPLPDLVEPQYNDAAAHQPPVARFRVVFSS
ncbi:MAG TPA: hypothetical protein DEV81_15505, partial [Cyanobacteria bacterium UBA11049]|nr:hypothetical protein [Cyanobacteria bacterium UBA11049]